MNAGIAEQVGKNATGLSQVELNDEVFFKISSVDAMRHFFMSIVSDSNHWMFVSSNGGISAGRKNANYALFPYYTDDKITESAEITGSKTILRISVNGTLHTWEPFSVRSEELYNYERNLYKNRWGNKIIFEEINHNLSLTFRYEWNNSNQYGFIKKSAIINDSLNELKIQLADGLQNILPFGVGSELQNAASNLADAYKRSELVPQAGLGIYALSAIIVDKAEPSEALQANIAWSTGLSNPTYLLSSRQLKTFRTKGMVIQEEDVKGEKGAYFVVSDITLLPNEKKEWIIVANVNQNHAAIIQLSNRITTDTYLQQQVLDDIQSGTNNLKKLVAAADGLQTTADSLKDARHYSNTLFNIMRGGIFDNNYQIEKDDFINYLLKANQQVFENSQSILKQLPAIFSVFELHKTVNASGAIDLYRLATEYLPLKFSRRHGDPSRPWNIFSINTRSEIDGSKILDYQGNWRDIFQNWEALAHSYPGFIQGMIFKFLNASTFDGYNPYRVMKGGFDWETIEPDNPWSYIGYWGDHQIIYLLKFFEFLQNYKPGDIQNMLNNNCFVYANVPYRIKTYDKIVLNPKDTILFDHAADHKTRERIKQLGADGALLTDINGNILHVSCIEKILATVLSKLSNFVPEGGIWMNTQRPEWNDANNALVGNGLSMVTLCYLRRFLIFFNNILDKDATAKAAISEEMLSFFNSVATILQEHVSILSSAVNDADRKKITDALGTAGSQFREQVYNHQFSGKKELITVKQITECFTNANAFLEQAINANKRQDNLYHTYNLISSTDSTVQVSHLSEMLEGQVAVLSAGFLSPVQSLQLLDALKNSSLYRKDQYSYLLYPNKNLPKFLNKNTIPSNAFKGSELLQQLIKDNNLFIVEKDINGDVHFNGNFRNANDVATALTGLDSRYHTLVEKERALVLQAFETVFNHKEFTGRSGTFFGYEGLGSIYWHMVSKLLLAVQENCLRAVEQNADKETIQRLIQHYYDINEGIGVHKPPQLYGAFPTDPYSHTPMNKGAQQPGMTGQVKEDILCRFGELGVSEKEGKLFFNPVLLKINEFSNEALQVVHFTINGDSQKIKTGSNALFFTCCQVPVVYTLNDKEGIETELADGTVIKSNSTMLTENLSTSVFERNGTVKLLTVFFNKKRFIS